MQDTKKCFTTNNNHMGNYNKGDRFGGNKGGNKFSGKRDFGAKRSFGNNRDRDQKEMHRATCSECGNSCEVPFRPTGDKPVFCSNCFKKQSGDSGRGSYDERRGGFKDRNDRPRFDDRRSYQDNAAKPQENYKAQFEQLNAKLDRILKALTPAISEHGVLVQPVKNQKFEKAPNKEVDTAALKKVLTKTLKPKAVAKKTAVKKTTAKKTPAKRLP
jgi:CxxC-x17-CxxC domain-containing protein